MAAAKVTGNKTNVPVVKNVGIPVKYDVSKTDSFDYWATVSNQFTKASTIKIPAKSHKALNKALKQGWSRTNFGEVKLVNKNLYLIVFVEKEVEKATPKLEVLGVDVGISNGVATSDGHLGLGLGEAMLKHKAKRAEQQRQKHSSKIKKTELKQILDKEAQVIVARCNEQKCTLAIEDRHVLNNLKSGKLQGWARCYFANRVETLCKEQSVFVVSVNPAYTSLHCHQCGSRGLRDGKKFECPSCQKTFDADTNASINIAIKGRQAVDKIITAAIRLSLKRGHG